jgi:hypothetical protein
MKRLKLFFRYLYSLNHYWGCERLTLWDYLYAKRIGIITAWEVSYKIINGF